MVGRQPPLAELLVRWQHCRIKRSACAERESQPVALLPALMAPANITPCMLSPRLACDREVPAEALPGGGGRRSDPAPVDGKSILEVGPCSGHTQLQSRAPAGWPLELKLALHSPASKHLMRLVLQPQTLPAPARGGGMPQAAKRAPRSPCLHPAAPARGF